MEVMEGKLLSEIHLQQNNNVRSLSCVSNAMKVRGEGVQMFHMIVCVIRSYDEMGNFLT